MDALSKEELLALLRTAKACSERNWLMILVAFNHGLRAGEVCGGWYTRRVDGKTQKSFHPGITGEDVHDGYLTVKRLKNSLRTTQPLVSNPDPLFDESAALIEFARKAKPGRSIFGVSRFQFWRILRKYAAIAGIPTHKAHPHVLKHSLAMHAIPHAGIENVRQYLGHKSLSSTGAYLRVSDEDASAAIVNALGRKEVRAADKRVLSSST